MVSQSGMLKITVCGIVCLSWIGCSPTTRKTMNGEQVPANWAVRVFKAHPVENEANWVSPAVVPAARVKFTPRAPKQVAPGYEIELTSASDEKLNGRYRIPFDGRLELPYGIIVQTNGLAENQLNQKIIGAYSDFFKAQPTMEIAIVDKMYYVDVRGLVKKPGQYLVRHDSSLDEVLAQAGGLNEPSTTAPELMAHYVRIQQGDNSATIKLSEYFAGVQGLDPAWQGGETFFFLSERRDEPAAVKQNYVQVLGQVRSPGDYPFSPEKDILDYIVRAGGPTDRANLDNVEVLRMDGQEKQSVVFDLQRANDGDLLPQLKGGDILVIHAENPSPLEKKTRLAAEFSTIITSIAAIAIAVSTF